MHKLKRSIVSLGLVIFSLSGCHKEKIPDIVSVGDCEHGIVSESNLAKVQEVFVEAARADVLISAGCYQANFIKKHHDEINQ